MEHRFTNDELLEGAEYKPCGDVCFLDMYSDEVQEAIDWNREPEVEMVDLILSLAADTRPCSLKTLLPRTDCYKVKAKAFVTHK